MVRLTTPPALAIEILSPSDANRLERTSVSRIEGKRLDYAGRGLLDYLEVDLSGPEPRVIRFELRDGDLTEVDRVTGQVGLTSDRPFRYSLRPADLAR
jgi:Uma2 family endonuclease